MLKRFKHFLKIIIFIIAYIHQNLVNVSNYKDNNFQEMLESFKHLNEKFHGEMRSGSLSFPQWQIQEGVGGGGGGGSGGIPPAKYGLYNYAAFN